MLAGGVATMATEMLSARLLAPYFGTSFVVWAILIGTLLLYMAVGYLLGYWPRTPSKRPGAPTRPGRLRD